MTELDINKNLMGYSPNDFFYISATETLNMPPDASCSQLTSGGWNDAGWDMSCNPTNFSNNKEDCIRRELCFNKEKALELAKIENVNNGSKEKYLNSRSVYIETIWNTGNMIFGIAIIGYMIYEYKNV
jgi:hypothetical protein